jgi:hypothetical protein
MERASVMQFSRGYPYRTVVMSTYREVRLLSVAEAAYLAVHAERRIFEDSLLGCGL